MFEKVLTPVERNPGGSDACCIGIYGRESPSDLISVDKMDKSGDCFEVLLGIRGFANAIGASDQPESWFF